MARYRPAVYEPPPAETVEDDGRGVDSVETWLALECEAVQWNAGDLFRTGVPCRRWLTRAAETKQVFVDNDDEAVWGETAAETQAGAMDTEEREISPARYAYEAPVVLTRLPWALARWAYETFKATEFDSMYRLRDGGDWHTYVAELRAGMASK